MVENEQLPHIQDTLQKVYDSGGVFNHFPILQQGELIVNRYHMYFTCDTDDDGNLVIENHTIINEKESSKLLWSSSGLFTIAVCSDNGFEYRSKNLDTAETVVYRRQKNDRMLKAAEERAFKTAESEVALILTVMIFINWMCEHPENKEIVKETSAAKRDSGVRIPSDNGKTSEKMERTFSPQTVCLNGIRITTGNRKIYKAITSKKMVRHTEAWTVRGHVRHYKNGKTVFIKPYQKGKGKVTPKTYVLGKQS